MGAPVFDCDLVLLTFRADVKRSLGPNSISKTSAKGQKGQKDQKDRPELPFLELFGKAFVQTDARTK